MYKGKLAYWFGFGAIALLSANYLFLIASLIYGGGGVGFLGVTVAVTLVYLIPIIAVAVSLYIGRKKPGTAGEFEIVLGLVGAVPGLLALINQLSSGINDFWNPHADLMESGAILSISILSILIAGILIVVSGVIFMSVSPEKSNPPNLPTGNKG